MDRPFFCLTSDIDWASDYAIEDLIAIATGFSIKPTLFATHQSPALEKNLKNGRIEIGLHPNFLPGSTHGHDVAMVIEHICGLFPKANAFRSHCFYSHFGVEEQMLKRHIRYDSNLSLYLQPGIVPLRRTLGGSCLPVFWEDDVHWLNKGTWQADQYLAHFLTPGLKIINVHPFFIAANIPNQKYYLKIKDHIQTLSSDTVQNIRYQQSGARTFLLDLLQAITQQGHQFLTFSEMCAMFPLENIIHQ